MPAEFEHSSVGAPPAKRDTARLPAALFLIALVLAAGVAVLGYEIVHSSSSAQQEPTQAGLVYSRKTMLWEKGPQVQTSRTVHLHSLSRALRGLAARHDIDVPQLIKRYGGNRSVDLVVLAGKFNTLPPAEGVDIYGQVVVLVDVKTRRVLLMTR